MKIYRSGQFSDSSGDGRLHGYGSSANDGNGGAYLPILASKPQDFTHEPKQRGSYILSVYIIFSPELRNLVAAIAAPRIWNKS